jgi:hypothetical protein
MDANGEAIVVDRPRPAGGRGRSIGWWYGAAVIDLVHMPIVIAVVMLGASKWNGPVYVTIVSIGVILQVATLGCPVMALTGWMRRRHAPDYKADWSLTFWLYHRYGRTTGIAVFLFFLGVATLVRIIAF